MKRTEYLFFPAVYRRSVSRQNANAILYDIVLKFSAEFLLLSSNAQPGYKKKQRVTR
jgi:hypothetical protein